MKIKGRSLLFLFVALCLLTTHSMVKGARIAGEEGVTPVTPAPKQQYRRPPSAKPSPKATVPRNPIPAKDKTVPEKVIGQEKRITEPQKKGTRYVTIDFDNVDIALFIKFISELTGKNFVIDNAVKGKVTIISPTKITAKEAYKVFESVLEVHGYTTVPAGSIIKIVPAVEARSKDIETLFRKGAITPEDKVVTQLIPLKYADPNELKKLFTPLISKSSIMVTYPPTGMLIVTDVLSNIKRLLHIIEAIDVPGIGEELSVVPLIHASAVDMGKSLNDVFQRRGGTVQKGVPGGGPVIKIVPDERTNALIILASEDDSLKVKELIRLLDKETPRGEGDIHVYYLQNANAEDLAKVLMAIPTKQGTVPQRGKAPVISKEVQIVADKATNALVITAKRDDFLVLENVIKKLDIARRMVYIEALIMEVSVSKQFDLGVEWSAAEQIGTYEGKNIAAFGGSKPSTTLLPSVSAATGTAAVSLQPGLSFGVVGEAITISGINFPTIAAVVKAFKSDSDVHILSTPQIMTTDNEEAEIKVADNIPFLTRQERSTTTTGIDYSSYEFKDVGVTLNIIPQINQERFVRLKISQEVSQVVNQEEIGLPTTLKRTAKTTVIIKDGHTVVIGGLIAETLNKTNYQVPCLGNITGLGWLFRSVSEGADRKNLYIFLTPHIIENPVEAQKVYEEKKEDIEKIREGVIKMYEGRRKEKEDMGKKEVVDE